LVIVDDLVIDYPFQKLRNEVAITIRELLKLVKKVENNYSDYELFKMFLDAGGCVSGGFLISHLYDGVTKDVDILFNDNDKYVWAKNLSFGKNIDVLYYKYNPVELFDISFVYTWMDKNDIYMTKSAHEAHKTKISDIYLDRVIFPDKVQKRLYKYNDKYGVKFKKEQLIAFNVMFDIDDDKVFELSC
jgi:hypothetical protein